MALALRQDDIALLIASECGPKARYRALVIQSSDMSELAFIIATVEEVVRRGGMSPEVLPFAQFFDDVGAESCEAAWERIVAVANQSPVILAGPLHFLDYWSDSTKDVFWRRLATFSSGPGIIVTDSPRTEGIDGPFRLVGRLGETSVRLFKSRLALT